MRADMKTHPNRYELGLTDVEKRILDELIEVKGFPPHASIFREALRVMALKENVIAPNKPIATIQTKVASQPKENQNKEVQTNNEPNNTL